MSSLLAGKDGAAGTGQQDRDRDGTHGTGATAVPALPPGAHLVASRHLQSLSSQYRSALGGPGSRRPPPGAGLVDWEPVDEELLTALVVELGLDRARELPELWLGHSEFDFPAAY